MEAIPLVAFVFISLIATGIWYSIPVSHSEAHTRDGTYRGAVLEMEALTNPELEPVENMLENVKIMFEYGLLAKEQEADIMVFPEYVLYNNPPKHRPSFLSYTQYVPDPGTKVVLCDSDAPFNYDKVVREMSCIAKSLKMYLVFNLPERVDCIPDHDPDCPEDGHYFFNANVVFDRKGVVVARWRKLHLFQESFFNVGNNDEEAAIFTTDFGVTFTQHICFDIIFYRPSLSNIEKFGIRDVIMPTSWVDYLPFYTAPQMQYSWSRGAGVNLLVAGHHKPQQAAVGSGIYTGATDITNSVYVYDDTLGTKLLVHDVTKWNYTEGNSGKSNSKQPVSPSSELFRIKGGQSVTKVSPYHNFFMDDLSNYTRYSILRNSTGKLSGTCESSGKNEDSIKYNLEWKLQGDGDYSLFLYSGVTGFEEYWFFSQIAALLYCPNGFSSCGGISFQKPQLATFQHLNLTLQFDVPHLFPSIIDQDSALIGEDKWHYVTRKDGDKYTASIINTEPLDFIYSASIIGRLYSKDPFCQTNIC